MIITDTKDVEFLKQIVCDVVQIINDSFEVKLKDSYGDLITNLDIEIEQLLIKQIKEKYPNFDIVSEETNTSNTPTTNCFIIDPIDGTVNFASGLPLWGIQIAMIKDSKIDCSVIYLPKLNELYWADESSAYLNGQKIHCKKQDIKQVLYGIEGKNHLPSEVRMKRVVPHARLIGSASVAFSWVAKGAFGGYAFRGDTCWDYVPGQFLVKQAGGVIINEEHLHIASSDEHLANLLKKYSKVHEEDCAYTNFDEVI